MAEMAISKSRSTENEWQKRFNVNLNIPNDVWNEVCETFFHDFFTDKKVQKNSNLILVTD